MGGCDNFILLCILICNAIAQSHAGCPNPLCLHAVHDTLQKYHGYIEKRHVFFRHIQHFCKLRKLFVTEKPCIIFHCLPIRETVAFLLSSDKCRNIIIHNNNVFNLPVLQIQLFIDTHLGFHHFFDQHIILTDACIKMLESFLKP